MLVLLTTVRSKAISIAPLGLEYPAKATAWWLTLSWTSLRGRAKRVPLSEAVRSVPGAAVLVICIWSE